MPLELGLAIAWQKMNPGRHTWFVFESKPRRLEKSLSDLKGTDEYLHNGRPKRLFSELSNAFHRSRRYTSVREMLQVFSGLKDALPRIMLAAGARSPFTARVFGELRAVAAALTDIYAPND
jgi:hypothetical protein